MNILSAETFAKQGFAALRVQNWVEAAEAFRKALDIDRDRNRRRPEMRYLSYYGLSLSKAGLSQALALEACRKAVSQQANDPVLFLNLGRVLVAAGRAVPAMRAFEDGLRVQPGNHILRQELARLDRRGRPPLAWLSRNHPLNRFLGKLRATLGRRPAPGVASG